MGIKKAKEMAKEIKESFPGAEGDLRTFIRENREYAMVLAQKLAILDNVLVERVKSLVKDRGVGTIKGIASVLEEVDQYKDAVYRELGFKTVSKSISEKFLDFLRESGDPEGEKALKRLVPPKRFGQGVLKD